MVRARLIAIKVCLAVRPWCRVLCLVGLLGPVAVGVLRPGRAGAGEPAAGAEGEAASASDSTEASRDANAGEDRARARRFYGLAEAHYAKGEFKAALKDYETGYEASALPGFLINMAQCHRRLGNLRAAKVLYQRFIVVAPDSPLREEVEAFIAELDKFIDDDVATSDGQMDPAQDTTPGDDASAGGKTSRRAGMPRRQPPRGRLSKKQK